MIRCRPQMRYGWLGVIAWRSHAAWRPQDRHLVLKQHLQDALLLVKRAPARPRGTASTTQLTGLVLAHRFNAAHTSNKDAVTKNTARKPTCAPIWPPINGPITCPLNWADCR